MYQCFGWGTRNDARDSKLRDVESAIADIRRELNTNVVTHRQLADMAGVGLSEIHDVRLVACRSHLDEKQENLKRVRVW
jgi:hypothetical protein